MKHFLSIAVLAAAVSLSGANPVLQWADGIGKNLTNRSVVYRTELKGSNTAKSFMLFLPNKKNIRIETGRGQESLTLQRNGEAVNWSWRSIDGTILRPNRIYYPNGVFQDGFNLSGTLRQWSYFISGKFRRDLDTAFLKFSIEERKGKLQIFFDDILMVTADSTADMMGKQLSVTLPPGTMISNVKDEKLPETAEQFYPVKLTSRFNAAGRPAKLNTPDKIVTFKGIPFEISENSVKNHSSIDLGQSRFMEGTLSRSVRPHRGTFGGRWYGALSGNRNRIQFRIPFAPYSAVYLLASFEKSPDRTADVTAQFYRAYSGFPKNYTAEKVEVSGKELQLIKIPVEPGNFRDFSDLNTMEMELTGKVYPYRNWPDPSYYSIHHGGIPSGVQIYAVTLETLPVTVDFAPEAFANVWVDSTPGYRVTLTNHTNKPVKQHLKLNTISFDQKEELVLEQGITVPALGKAVTRFDLPVKKYGWHEVKLNCDGKIYRHTLAKVRKREIKGRPFNSKGFMFGFWNGKGTHQTPGREDSLKLFGMIGFESFSHNPTHMLDPVTENLANKYGFKSFWTHHCGIRTKWNISDYEKNLKNSQLFPSLISEPVYLNIFAEPWWSGNQSTPFEFYGEKPYVPTEQEKKEYIPFKEKVLAASKLIRKNYPHAKILMPWGDPLFAVPFLKDPETRNTFDGIAFDAGIFERLPEQQIHQCSLHRMMMFHHYWKKYRKTPPVMISVEGPCIAPVAVGALTETENASHTVRSSLILGAYGINRQFAAEGIADCASYWGEQHYGGGAFSRLNDLNPHAVYAAMATLVRHLRHMEFVRWVPTGSHSVYCLEYKSAKNGELLHVMWTIRGKRPVKFSGKVRVFDMMDNLSNRAVLSPCPLFVYNSDGKFTLESPDHSDSKLAKNRIKLGNFGKMKLRQSQDKDDEYINSFPAAVRRFPAEMKVEKVSSGLAVTLPEQKKERFIMPYYTTLTLEKPVTIPGKASHITVEATANSDWGRIVYVLKDAKGEKWISVGQKDNWNVDDTPNASYFNFDGKRFIRFELPSNLPYDRFRENGTTWWGCYGGDQMVDLPLTLEKVFIERRRHVMYVNTLEKVVEKPVILGNLYAEYASKEMMKPQPDSVMPILPQQNDGFNIIKALDKTGTLPASEITEVRHPDYLYDGSRGLFYFKEMPQALSYDIYLSLNKDGSQAICLGKNIRKSGTLVTGFLADTDFYAFIVYRDKSGRQSKVSKPFHLKLKDNFSNK